MSPKDDPKTLTSPYSLALAAAMVVEPDVAALYEL
jgi:hypothetical protein